MPLPVWGLICGAVISVLVALVWPTWANAFAVLLYAAILCPLGALVGWATAWALGRRRV